MFDFNQLYKPQKIRITEAFDFNDIEDDFDTQPEYSNNMTLPLYVMNRLKTMAKITYEERRDKADMFKLMYEQLNDYLNKPENSVFNIFNMLIKDGCDPVVRSAKASSFKRYGYYEKALSLQIGFDCTKNTKLASYPVEVLYLLYVLNFEYTAGCYDTTLQTYKLAEFNFRKQVGIRIRMNEGDYIEWDGDKGRMTDETYMVMEQMVDDAISYCKPNMCSGDLVDAIRLKNTITDTTEYTDEQIRPVAKNIIYEDDDDWLANMPVPLFNKAEELIFNTFLEIPENRLKDIMANLGRIMEDMDGFDMCETDCDSDWKYADVYPEMDSDMWTDIYKEYYYNKEEQPDLDEACVMYTLCMNDDYILKISGSFETGYNEPDYDVGYYGGSYANGGADEVIIYKRLPHKNQEEMYKWKVSDMPGFSEGFDHHFDPTDFEYPSRD